MGKPSGVINKLGRAKLSREEIRDGLDFLIENAPEDFRPYLDIDSLTERYSDEIIKETRGESKIRKPKEWKELFLRVYGTEAYGNYISEQNNHKTVLESIEPYVIVSTSYLYTPTDLSVIQPGITPMRAIRMATISNREFKELIRLMPIAVINNMGTHLWQGNNRTLQAHYRGKELPAVHITLRNRTWGQNLNLVLTKQKRYVNATYGGTGVEALQKALYQRMIEDIKG